MTGSPMLTSKPDHNQLLLRQRGNLYGILEGHASI